MYELNGKPRLHKPTSTLGRLKNIGSLLLMRLHELPPPLPIGIVLLLLVLALSLTACATPSAPSSEPARNPTMPPASTSQPSVPYLETAQGRISAWLKKLADTLGTP